MIRNGMDISLKSYNAVWIINLESMKHEKMAGERHVGVWKGMVVC